jgi:Ran GTPase-activating protein (RanGAP) involved in mRNA processing and transport
MKNVTLVYLDLSSNDFGEPSASYLSEMLVANKTLKELIITCNKLGEAGGKLLQEGVEENKTLTVLDLRLTDISAENEYSINQMIRSNADSNKK